MYGMDLLNPASFKRMMMSLLNGKIMQPVQGVIPVSIAFWYYSSRSNLTPPSLNVNARQFGQWVPGNPSFTFQLKHRFGKTSPEVPDSQCDFWELKTWYTLCILSWRRFLKKASPKSRRIAVSPCFCQNPKLIGRLWRKMPVSRLFHPDSTGLLGVCQAPQASKGAPIVGTRTRAFAPENLQLLNARKLLDLHTMQIPHNLWVVGPAHHVSTCKGFFFDEDAFHKTWIVATK